MKAFERLVKLTAARHPNTYVAVVWRDGVGFNVRALGEVADDADLDKSAGIILANLADKAKNEVERAKSALKQLTDEPSD